ncbi:MAG: hypothetical protein KFF72_05355 [Arthrospira sp. SH-MAG29]|nr:hypothetical protein [Arthrospira sp. SH-MAG29]MBS0015780.1 hypothetical protein [Arthrospira sp. SH-MAG29]
MPLPPIIDDLTLSSLLFVPAIMAILELVSVAALGVLVGLFLFNINSKREEQRQLDNAFYQLIESQDGEISLIQLAALARVSADVAQEYLDRQAGVFAAIPEFDQDGNTFYRFPRLRLPKQFPERSPDHDW